MAVLSKNGHEIGRLKDVWWDESYRSNGWILRNHGHGWKRLCNQTPEGIEEAYRFAKMDLDGEHESAKQLRLMVRDVFTLKQLPMVRTIFFMYINRTERQVPVVGDVDGFLADMEDVMGLGIISLEDAKRMLQLHLDYRLSWNEGLWSIVIVSGGATDGRTIVEVMMGDKIQRRKRMLFHKERYTQSGYMDPKIVASPATTSEVLLYTLLGNEIWKPGVRHDRS